MAILLVLSLAITGATPQESNALAGGQQQASAATATATAQAPTPAAAPARDRQICRRHTRIGTLAGFESICHTEAEWRAVARGTQSSYEQLQGTHGSTNHRVSTDLRDRNGPF
jgi:hypothetical protein